MFEIVDGRTTDGRTDDGRTPEHGYTISSPCEPKGSGELKKDILVKFLHLWQCYNVVFIKLKMGGTI